MVGDEKIGGSWKNPVLGRGGVTKNQYIVYREDSLGLGKFADLRGDLARKKRVVYLRSGGEVDTPMRTMIFQISTDISINLMAKIM